MKRTTLNFIEDSQKIHSNKYDYNFVEYEDMSRQVIIVCPVHGKFQQYPNSHLHGHGCTECGISDNADNNRMKLEDFIKRSSKIHKNKYDYSYSTYTNSKTKVCIVCPNHGKFHQIPNSHLMGMGCSKCGRNKVSKLFSSSVENFITNSTMIHGDKYDYSHVKYVNNHKKVKIVCKQHGGFYQSPNSHIDGSSGCPRCNKIISSSEIDFLNHFEIPNTKNNRRKYIKPYKVDGYDEKTNTIYEFLGDYWHGNPLKYNSFDINKSCKKTFGELYNATIDRFEYLKKLGFHILYIWETDWRLFKRECISGVPKIQTF